MPNLNEDNIYQHMNIMTRNDYPFAGYNFDMNRDPFEWELNSTKALSRAFVIDTHVGFEVRFEVLNEAKLPAPWRQVLKPHNIRSVLKVSVGKFMADTNYMKLLPDTQPLNPSSETNLIKTIGKVMLSYQKVWGKNHYQIVVFNTGAGQRVNFLKALSKKLATIPGMKPYDKLAAELMGVQKQFFVVFKNVYGSPIHEEYDAEFYPSDHELGMVVPKGGSSCSKCVFFKGEGKCGNKGFHEWRVSKGAKDPSVIPAPPNQYCCDLYESGESLKEDDENINARPRIHRGAWKWRTPDGEYPRPTKYPAPDPDFGPGRPFSNRQVLVDPETGQHWMCLVNYYHDGGVVSIYPEKLVNEAEPVEDDTGFLYDENTNEEVTSAAFAAAPENAAAWTRGQTGDEINADARHHLDQMMHGMGSQLTHASKPEKMKEERLDELFDKPEQLHIIAQRPAFFEATFSVNNISYSVGAALIGDSVIHPPFWEFGFSIDQWGEHIEYVTGTGNAATVYSSVAAALKIFLDKYNPKTFRFFAKIDEPSKQKLYAVFAKRVAKQFGRKLVISHETTVRGKAKIFWLIRKGKFGPYDWAEPEAKEFEESVELIQEAQIKVLQNYSRDHIDIIDVIARDSEGKLFGDVIRYKDREYKVFRHPRAGACIAIS